MPSLEELKDRRDAVKKREERVDRLVKGERVDLHHLRKEIEEEHREQDRFQKRRRELEDALEGEIEADEVDAGQHSENWEEWVEARRDELADMVDASESRVLRLLEREARSENRLDELVKRDERLEKRIVVIRKRIERKQESSGQLTRDFHIAEFDCNDGTPVPDGMEPHLKALCVQHLQPLRDSGGSIHINSGYRTTAYNAAIGGASQSYHIYTLRMKAPAADHIQAGRSAPDVQSWHDAHNPPDGMGYYSGFTHIDDRGYRARWWGVA
jgi:hypothetical protein